MKAFGAGCLLQIAHQVAVRTHLHRGPVGKIAVVHLKAIVVFKHRDHVSCAGVLEKVRPGLRIIMLGLEHGDKVFVPKFRHRAIDAHMVFVLLRASRYICARIPFAPERRNRIHAPVNEDSKLRIPVPVRDPVLRQ